MKGRIRAVKIVWSCLFSLCVGAYAARVLGDTKDTWKKIYDRNDIVVFMKDPSANGTISVRGEGLLGFSPAEVFSVIENTKRAPEWMPLVKERRTLEQLDATSRIDWTHIGLPWPLRDRYFIDRAQLTKNEQDGTYTISIKSVPEPKKSWLVDDKVLGFLHYSELTLTPLEGKKTYLTIEVNTDPRGEIPLWMVNLQQRQWPRKFIEGLRDELLEDRKKKIQSPQQPSAPEPGQSERSSSADQPSTK